MLEYQVNLVDFLVSNNALQFGSFTLKSGRQSPYFFNARNLVTGQALEKISEVYADLIKEKVGFDSFDVLYGPAYAGIPLAAATAVQLSRKYGVSKRFAYDRKEEKNYGDLKNKVIVGEVKAGDRVLVIDDMITTGGTKLDAKAKLEAQVPGVAFAGIVIIFDRKEKDDQGVYSCKMLAEKGLPVFSVINAPEVFEYLKNNEKTLPKEVYNAFQEYRKKYGAN